MPPDSFADIHGAKRFFWIWITKQAALMRGVPLLLSPQMIGTFTHHPLKWLAAVVRQRAVGVPVIPAA